MKTYFVYNNRKKGLGWDKSGVTIKVTPLNWETPRQTARRAMYTVFSQITGKTYVYSEDDKILYAFRPARKRKTKTN